MKRARQEKILELIRQYEIETQEDLAGKLQEAGIAVTQATVSRDIRELSLTKEIGTNGRPKYISRDDRTGSSHGFTDRYARVWQDGIISIEQADNLIVIKTVSGMAMAVAAAVDAMRIEEIVGSIAGDDTIMCAVKTAELVPAVINKMMEENKDVRTF